MRLRDTIPFLFVALHISLGADSKRLLKPDDFAALRDVDEPNFSPDGQTFVDRLRGAGYLGRCAWSVGETLAWGSGTESSPRSRVQAWMHSSPHRAVLLGRSFREAGIGAVGGVPGNPSTGVTYVGEFGHRRC